MRGGTLFSGIGAPEQAMPWVNWRWSCEVDKFPSAVLAARHPGTRNLGDVTKVSWHDIKKTDPVDLIVFGSPCQDFSQCGRRRGLDGDRGALALFALGIVDTLRPRWFLFENVPGMLSSNGGRDFSAFLTQVDDCGYGWAFRVIDARFFGLAQRRRRLFLVGYRDPVTNFGDWRPAAGVLFDRPGLLGNPPPRRQTKTSVARALTASPGGCSGKFSQLTFVDHDGKPLNALCFGGGNTSGEIEISTTLTRHGARLDFDTETFAVVGPLCSHSPRHGHAMTTQQAAEAGHIVTHPLTARYDSSPDGTGRGTPIVPVAFDCKRNGQCDAEVTPPLRAMNNDASHANGGGQVAVAYAFQPHIGRSGRGQPSEIVPALGGASAGATSDSRPCIAVPDDTAASTADADTVPRYAVRRLMPVEAERLQGFPDNYTNITYRGKPAADGPRYRALGNSMAVPVVAWIGRRIAMVDRLLRSEKT